jgi:hypothetical protein
MRLVKSHGFLHECSIDKFTNSPVQVLAFSGIVFCGLAKGRMQAYPAGRHAEVFQQLGNCGWACCGGYWFW